MPRLRKQVSLLTMLALGLGLLSPWCGAQEPGESMSLPDAVRNGNLLLQLRPRYNFIDEQAKSKYTDVSTIRALLGWRTAPYHDFRLTAQAIHTDFLGAKHTNDDGAQAARSPYPLLPDPRVTDVNQLFVDYTGLAETRIRAGKQIIKLDNERFISDNDFRQTPIAYTGVTIVNHSLPQTELYLGHITRIRNTAGAQADVRLEIVRAAYNPADGHRVGAFGYFHDQKANGTATGFANSSHKILGLRMDGAFSVGDKTQLLYIAEGARQTEYAGGDSRINANYARVGGGVWWSNVGLRLDHEIKGSNNGVYGFQTPLTDRYAFNGTALQFTTTPRQGLRDTWITVRGEIAKFDLYAEYHIFRADLGGFNFGQEFDVSVAYPLRKNLIAKLQHAHYRPGSTILGRLDVQKT